MKRNLMPVAFGIVALTIVSVAWTFPITGRRSKFGGDVVRIGDGAIVAVNGEVPVSVVVASEPQPR